MVCQRVYLIFDIEYFQRLVFKLVFLVYILCCQGRWQSQMQQLRDMGIQDEELMLRVLQATDGDIQAALELIFAGGPGL